MRIIKTCPSGQFERSGVILGREIEKLLPLELALYNYINTQLDFLRRYTEGQTMMYNDTKKAKEALGKGQIILCLDKSSSTHPLDAQSKVFALALMSIPKRQKRVFCYIPPSNPFATSF
ncbi:MULTISPECIES: hypothetical protein [Virgibacillus]|nr:MULTISPECIES: hypothetical protein [Virgibacillus]MBS7427670.1 hypothetical protein [Virgibacillus sp. 19R1-5]MED3739281.1 hypothetical protein [Virgibacillus pantothenticus]QTY17561.1 hypothetical protein KBP50_06860 [Virgibacillus pantothenticus]